VKLSTFKKRSQFIYLQKNGTRFFGEYLYVDKIKSSPSYGITVSTKFGTACERNRFKRRVREAVRNLAKEIPLEWAFVVYPRKKAKTCTSLCLEEELKKILLSPDNVPFKSCATKSG